MSVVWNGETVKGNFEDFGDLNQDEIDALKREREFRERLAAKKLKA